jgi:hypothetical protein
VALLPLFPLEVVLLPGTPLPLHIFEPRYKEMIGECLANDAPFGVVRALDEGIAEVGCTAEIITVTKEYPDGRMDLIAEGRKRFEVLELNQERSFLRAEVLLVPDEPNAAAQEEKVRAIQLHRAQCRTFRPPIRTSFRFTWQDRCLSISISNRNCWRCALRASGFRPSRGIWRAFCPSCAALRRRVKRQAGTGMYINLASPR